MKEVTIMSECATCGTDERVCQETDTCEWCAMDALGAPHGRCPDCSGAWAHDETCACRPTLADVRAEEKARRKRGRGY